MRTEKGVVSEKARRIRRMLLIAASVSLGALLALSVRVWPEQVKDIVAGWSAGGNGSPRVYFEQAKASLMDVLTEPYQVHAEVCDGPVIVVTRNPCWICWYLLIFPACVALAGMFWLFLWWLACNAAFSLLSLLASRLGVGLLVYAALSVWTHLALCWFMPLLEPLVLALVYLTLPFFILNNAALFGLNALNRFAYSHTSPHLAYPGISPMERIVGGAYPETPVFWELRNAAVLLCLWILVLPALVKWIRWMVSCLRGRSSRRSSPR